MSESEPGRAAIRATMLDAIHREYGDSWERNNAEFVLGDEFLGSGDDRRWPTLDHVLDVLSEAVEDAHYGSDAP